MSHQVSIFVHDLNLSSNFVAKLLVPPAVVCYGDILDRDEKLNPEAFWPCSHICLRATYFFRGGEASCAALPLAVGCWLLSCNAFNFFFMK